MSAKYIPIVKAVARDCGEAARTFGAILYLWIDGKPFYFSNNRIAETAGLSIATVKRHLQTLEENRWLVSAGRKRGRRTNTLELPYPKESILKQGFYRFPIPANNITGWSKCVVLSILCWRCDARDTGTLFDEERDAGIEWIVSHGEDCGLRRHQIEHAFAALRGIRKGNRSSESLPQIILYDSATLKVTIPPSLITGKSDSVQCPTIPVSSVPVSDSGIVADTEIAASANARADMSYVEADMSPLRADVSHRQGGYEPRIYTKHFNPNHSIIKSKPLGAGAFNQISQEEKTAFCSRFFREVADFRNLHFYSSDEKVKEAAEIAVAAVFECWSDNTSARNLFPDIPYIVEGKQRPYPYRFKKLLTACFLPSVTEGKNPPALMMYKIKELHKQFGPELASAISSSSSARKFAKQILPDLLQYLKKMEGTAGPTQRPQKESDSEVGTETVSENVPSADIYQYLHHQMQRLRSRDTADSADRSIGLRISPVDPAIAAIAAKHGHD